MFAVPHEILCLSDNNVVHLSERDCQYIVRYFDQDRDNGLNYKE